MEIHYLAEGDDLVFAGKENMETVSSLYLSPRYTSLGEELCEIRNVFTKEKFRRHGNMDALMKEAFICMQSEREPYTFLRPLQEKYFTPYGFVTIEERDNYRMNGLILTDALLRKATEEGTEFAVKGKSNKEYTVCPVKDENAEDTAAFMNKRLSEEADLYVLFSGHTVLNYCKSMTEKGGNVFRIMSEGETVCVFGYSLVKQEIVNEETKEVTVFSDKQLGFLLGGSGFSAEDLFIKEEEPIKTMVRIIDVRSILAEAESPKEFVLALKIYDERLTENAGLYILHCGPAGGRMTAIKIGDAEMKNAAGERLSAECEVTMENLARFLFGYRKAEDCFKVYVKSKEEEIFAGLNALKRVEKPYFICE